MDLEKISGLPIEYVDGKLVSKSKDMVVPRSSARQIDEARPYLRYFFSRSRRTLYYMYRNVHFRKDRKLLKKHRLRYDITVIAPGFEGKEFEKTVGHIHSKVRGTGITYTEVYEVIHGEAWFVFQKMKDKKVTKVVVYHAKEGDKVVVPPDHAHFTINPGKKVLIMSNWMCTKARSKYNLIKRRHGADYYFVQNENHKTEIIKNPNYQRHPHLEIKKPKQEKRFNLLKRKPMYSAFIESPMNFDFLVHPQRYKW
ncbi:glucose-6-phosphate isomerase family protein [Thermoproteota archaeon]